MKKIFITLLSVLFFLGCTLFQELIEPSDLVNLINDKKDDITPPVVIISSPSNYQEVGSNYQISGIVSDSGNSGIKRVYLKTDNGEYFSAALTASNWSANISVEQFGIHTNYIYAEDNAGNKSIPVLVIVEYISIPSIIILSPTNKSCMNISNILIEGTSSVDLPYTVAKVQIQLNGGIWKNVTGTTNWSILENLILGVNMLKARVISSDSKTNETAGSRVLYVSQEKFIAPDGLTGDYFGFSTSISADGNCMVAGAYHDDDTRADGGAVYYYHKSGSSWMMNKFVAPDGVMGESFGYSTAISADGNTIISGAPGDLGIGTLYRFHWNGSEWETNKFITIDGDFYDNVGYCVAVSSNGNTVLAGAYGDNGYSGSVYCFHWNDSTWETNKFYAYDYSGADYFGFSLAMSPDGNTIVVGAFGDDDMGANSGSIYRFHYNGLGWETNKFIPYDGLDLDEFGISVGVSADGNTLVAGAYGDDDKGNHSGSVYRFHYNGWSWETNKFIAQDGAAGDNFGISVAVSADGGTIVTGANYDDDKGLDSGSVYCFHWNGSEWDMNKFLAQDGAAGDNFGISVAISADGKSIIAGANLDDDMGGESGSFYLLRW
ncbi:MAG: hypothetical protein HPY53_12930 [Brevinematales bacterium]|nr:hypothetical protein [Brevinematales bacterium]